MSITVTAKVSRFEGVIGSAVSGVPDICVAGTVRQTHASLGGEKKLVWRKVRMNGARRPWVLGEYMAPQPSNSILIQWVA